MSSIFSVRLHEHFARKRAVQPSQQPNQASDFSQPEKPHRPENPGKENSEQKALDTFVKVSRGSHGGLEKAAQAEQRRKERLKHLDERIIQEMGNSVP